MKGKSQKQLIYVGAHEGRVGNGAHVERSGVKDSKVFSIANL